MGRLLFIAAVLVLLLKVAALGQTNAPQPWPLIFLGVSNDRCKMEGGALALAPRLGTSYCQITVEGCRKKGWVPTNRLAQTEGAYFWVCLPPWRR